MRITTEEYKISAEKYFKAIITQWLGQWWWIIALPIIVQIVLSFNNIAFIYTAIMTLFLIYPPLLLFLYYQHALTPQSRYNTLLKTVAITDIGIDLNFIQADENTPIIKPVLISWDTVTGVEFSRHYFALKLNSSNYQLLLIPYSAVSHTDQQILATYLDKKFNIIDI